MAKVVRDPDGNLWEERGGKWYEVEDLTRAGGILRGASMGQFEGFGAGLREELSKIGGNLTKGYATLMGDKELAAEVDAVRDQRRREYAGARVTGPGVGMTVGELAPSLATLPAGGMFVRPAAALAEQVALGTGFGALTSSGDAGMDAMVGGLLGGVGWGTGQLAGKVIGAIQQKGAATRAAIAEATPEPRGAVGIRAMEQAEAAGGVGGGATLPPGAGAAGGSAEEATRFGAATRPGAEGLMAGGGLPGALPGSPWLSAESRRLLARAEELGFRFTPGESTGSRVQQQIEAGLERSPYTSGAFEKLRNANRARVNELAVKAIGEEGAELGQGVLNNAHIRLGRVFEKASADVGTLKAGSTVLEDASEKLGAIIREAGEGGSVMPEVAKSAHGILGIWESAGQVTGKRLAAERVKLLDRAMDYAKPGTGKALEAQGLQQIIGVIDDVLEAGVPEINKRAVREARAQWRVLRSLESGSSIDAGGNVRSGALFQSLNRQFPMEMGRGNFETVFGKTATGSRAADLMDAVRIGQNFKTMIKDSGTATGMAMQGLLSGEGGLLANLTRPILGATLGRAYIGAPGHALTQGGVALSQAPNAAPALSGGLGGLGRVGMGLMGGF